MDTSISEEIIEEYYEVNLIGMTHGCEVWQNDQLLDGLNDLAAVKVLCIESMFRTVTYVCKIALMFLINFFR